ncbi:MAG: cytochrome c [Bacteroidetes bacterium]|nr:cytochrome c [Bacteroidota bacterium]MBS1973248.1 cytochrome c [Bacteroidota bacterium]
MKKIPLISFILIATITIISCSDVRRSPGRAYMPDMAYSRAYESYSVTTEEKDSLKRHDIFFSNLPVAGTIKRGEMFPFPLAIDKEGDTANYVASKQIINPITNLDSANMAEADRLFLVNCAICHGTKLDGNGPLYKGGDGPFAAKPATLVGDAKYEAMPAGQMFYSITYGKNKMGSYASQLDTRQRWMVIYYIKSKQAEAKGGTSNVADSTTKK